MDTLTLKSTLTVVDHDDAKSVLTVNEYEDLIRLIDKVAEAVGTKNYEVKQVD